MGVEPTSKAWEAFILPMNYARRYGTKYSADWGKCQCVIHPQAKIPLLCVVLSEHQLIGGVEHGEDGLRDPLHSPVTWVLLNEFVVLVLIDGEVPLIEELEMGDVRVEDARIQSDLPRCLLLSPVWVERRGYTVPKDVDTQKEGMG